MAEQQDDARATRFATSADGTQIAYESHGVGPVLVLVDGALCAREFGPAKPMTAALEDRYTVVSYDRRGRGESGDGVTDAESRQREIEDLAAVLAAVGPGETATASDALPFVVAFSSGAGLALEAAAAGMPMRALVGYEAPYVGLRAGKGGKPLDYEGDVEAMIARGDVGKVPGYFMVKMVGAPAFLPLMFVFMPKVKRHFARIGHTVLRDIKVMGDFTAPLERFAGIRVPVLEANGSKAADAMAEAQRAIADAVPGAEYEVLDGQTHNVTPAALAPVLDRFFAKH